jgi:ketosteroid isomerase-like protein
MRQWEEMRATLGGADILEPLGDFIHGGDRVAVRHIWHGMGQGPKADFEITNVFTLRDGKILYHEFFWDHAEALKAVGLDE